MGSLEDDGPEVESIGLDTLVPPPLLPAPWLFFLERTTAIGVTIDATPMTEARIMINNFLLITSPFFVYLNE